MKPHRLVFVTWVAVTFAGAGTPAPAPAAEGRSLHLTGSFATYYDDNILKYSDVQLTDLGTGQSPYRYGIAKPQDVVYRPALTLAWQIDSGNERKHALRVRGEAEFHGTNGVANFGAFDGTWRESFAGGRRLSLSYSRSPDHFLRRLHDADLGALPTTERYRDASYDAQEGGVAWRNPVPRASWLELGYRLERRRYSDDFRERDSDTHRGDLGLGWDQLPRDGTVRLMAGFSKRDARAEDGDPAQDETDLSDHGIGGGVEGRMELRRVGGWQVLGDAAYELERRVHDSQRPADRYNFGRTDLIQAFEIGLGFRNERRWSARGFYRLEQSRANLGVNAPLDSEIGSYTVNQIGIVLEMTGELWRRDGRAGSRRIP